MPAQRRAQKRKREPEPKTIQDLSLELVEEIARHLDVKDVPKLMMVNKRLYSSYAMDQSIVFGKHVDYVSVQGDVDGDSNWVNKFPSFYSPSLHNAFLLPFAKRVDSCDRLNISSYVKRSECFYAEWAERMFFGQLKSVNQLDFCVDTKEECLKFFTNFCGSVKKHAELNMYRLEKDEEVKEQLGKFIEKQLNGCEKLTLACNSEDCFHVPLEAMTKTQIKFIEIEGFEEKFDQIISWIVNHGIPSKNPEAVILIETESSRVGTFLSQMQGLQRVDDSANHSALVSRANELLRKSRQRFFSGSSSEVSFQSSSNEKVLDEDNVEERSHDWSLFDKNSSCFRRRIDPTTNCNYVLHAESNDIKFMAFHMSSR